MIRRMREELTFRVIVTAYGLTESTGVVSICRPDDVWNTSVGAAIEMLLNWMSFTYQAEDIR